MTATSLALLSGIHAALLLAATPHAAFGCESATSTMDATPSEIRTFFKGQGKSVLTFLGYSGAGYEDDSVLVSHATRILDRHDPRTTIVNIGATTDGIGNVYELAKKRGFTTTGIVSTQARESGASISPCVDHVFYVADATWGGFLESSDQLSPTSQAMVDVSDLLVAIGGGEVARDELVAARRAGKTVTFIPADMNHRLAIEKAVKKGQPPPTDFRGAAEAVFGDHAGPKR